MGVVLNALIGCIGALVGALTLSLVLPQAAPISVLSIYSVLIAFAAASIFLSVARLTTSHSSTRSDR